MEQNVLSTDKTDKSTWDGQPKADYSKLFRKYVLIALVSSVVPLLLVGWGISIYYSMFARSNMLESFQERIARHQKAIELFLNNQRSSIQLIAQTHTLEYLSDRVNLVKIFEEMNLAMKKEYGKTFMDLGIISNAGEHLAYIGPYDLRDTNYAQAFWFKEVMEKGVYISDMFLGFRKVPHFIIAVSRTENGQNWILRATIDAEAFRSLVEDVKIGRTGEVYLLNSEGVFQTRPRFDGKIMDKTSLPAQSFHQGIMVQTIESGDSQKQIVAHAWLKTVRWMLVVKQDYSEAFNRVNHANRASLIFLNLSVLVILLVSFFITRHMIKIIKKRDKETDRMNKQLIQTGKMAAIGELSAGVAHEINNPLGIIMTERQILLDKAEQTPNPDAGFKAQLDKSLTQIDTQLKRCKHTTQNLLRFSRRTTSMIEEVDLNAFLKEIIDLMEREAKSSGIKFFADFRKVLPPILSDPSQLQQVFLNLITNAVDSHDGKPYGSIYISTTAEDQGRAVKVTIADKGAGIRPEHLYKIFDPFFTTKPVGKGTGLGLSICYSIIKRLGGNITVESEPGAGTAFSVLFPITPPASLENSIGYKIKDT
ncbi:MAG: two-component sensor histidine kinase [Deltaproteobacteria bacterium]|nr:two-component sensor histidine kinase [Deltaproteobacteria bacterium]